MALQNTARAKQQSRTRLIIIVVLVLLVLGAAAFFLLGGKAKQEVQPLANNRPAGAVAVPVLSQEVKMGERIGTNMLRITYFKPSEVPADALLSPKEFLGRRAARRLMVANYITEDDLAAKGASSGFSGVTKLGKRVIVIPESVFIGPEAIRVGDRLDLLSIGSPTNVTNNPNALTGGIDPSVVAALGGAGPGAARGNGAPVNRNRNRNAAPVIASTATLIAENVEILSKGNKLIVVQLEPQDAHVTTLALASGANIRPVFRPFNDDTRLTPVPDVKVTTRLPRPSLDPDAITVFNGGDRVTERAVSSLYRYDGDNSERFSPNAEENDFSVEPMIQNLN